MFGFKKKKKEYISCLVKFEDSDLFSTYAIFDENVKEGDKLLIPFDEENISKVGIVVVVRRTISDEPPYNYELAKRIKKVQI